MMTLFQFPISHYYGKARWALEYKGIDYRIKNFVPGPHTAALRKLAPGTSVPFLIEDDKPVQGSDAIITYLDKKQSHPPRTPPWRTNGRYADANVGVPLRLLFLFPRPAGP